MRPSKFKEQANFSSQVIDFLSYYLSRVCTLSVVVSRPVLICGTLSYAFCFNNQTNQEDETENLEMEGLDGVIGEGGVKELNFV